MKRRTAWTCSISAALLIAGYVAWCGRTFYLPTRLDTTGLPPEVAAEIPALAAKEGILRTEYFRLDSFLYHLCHPYAERPKTTLSIRPEAEDVIVVSWLRRSPAPHSRGFPIAGLSSFYFIRRSGKWQRVEYDEYFHFRTRLPVPPQEGEPPPRGPMEDPHLLFSGLPPGSHGIVTGNSLALRTEDG